MKTRQELETELEKIEERLADAEGRMPAHSVRPHQMAALLELEEARDALLAEIGDRAAGQAE